MWLAIFGGPADLIIIFIVALVLLGPQKLPGVAKQLAQALREFRKVADDLTGTVSSLRDDVLGATSSVRDEITGITQSVHLQATNALKTDTPVVQLPLEKGSSSPVIEKTYSEQSGSGSTEDLMAPIVTGPLSVSPTGLQLSTLPASPPKDDLDAKGQ